MPKTTPDKLSPPPALGTEHVSRLLDRFAQRMPEKYMEGQNAHGGDLSTKGSIEWLLTEMENEVIDQWVYLQTVRERLFGRDK